MAGEIPSEIEAPTLFQFLAAALSAGIAVVVLVGWALGIDPLTQIIPGSIAMNPLTTK